jgi:cytidyltransferase-like protein
MSGSAGGNRIPRAVVEKTVQDYIDKILSKFPGFKKAKITGSYNAGVKQDFGDIDLIVQLEGTDKKLIKQDLAKYFATFPDSVIVPFKSDKYKGKKSLSSGELVTILYPIINTSDQFVQIDNIVSISEEELTFKNSFLDYPAEIQGLLLGLAKIICLEENPKDIFKRLGITNVPELEPNQEYEFNLSGAGLTLRIVTLDNFKEIDRTDVWKSSDWNTVKKLFINYNINTDFETLLKDLSTNLKNPRSKNRVKGLFKSMVSVKSGEKNTPKGDNKEKALQAVDKLLENNYIKNLGEYLVASLLPEEFINSLPKQTIALYPGKFKPPHKGHLEAVKYALQKADKVIIIISPKSFEEYNDEQSKQIWELYEKTLGSDASKVEIKISKDPSPIKTAYEIIENDPVNNYMALYGKGESNRWKSLNNKEKYPNAEPLDLGSIENKNIEGTSEVISSTNLRQAIKDGDKDRIKTFLPYGVDIDQFLEIINKKPEDKNIQEKILSYELDDIDYYADQKLSPLDVKFSNHFFDRVNDPRNKKDITDIELIAFFDRLSKYKNKLIDFLNKYKEVLTTDSKSNINIPFVKQANNIIAKTVMRKSNFATNDVKLIFEQINKINENNNNLEKKWILDLPKYNQSQTLSSQLFTQLYELKINEISLNPNNAVEIYGDIDNGDFTVGEYDYNYRIIKLDKNPYNSDSYYNIDFHEIGNTNPNPSLPTKNAKGNYIKILSTIYKIILDFTQEKKPEYIGISSLDESGYGNIYNNLTKTNKIPGYSRKDAGLQFKTKDGKSGKVIVLKKNNNLNEKNINEVGEGTSQPYETFSRYSNNEKFLKFSTDSGIDYEISLFPINKFLQVDFHLDTFSDDIYQETNKGELFRIMSTVIKEVKEFLKENKDLEILGIRYVPQEKSKNKGAFLSSNQRNKFYKAFISKIVPGTTYVEQGGVVFAIFPKKENIQENTIKNQALYINKLVNYCCDVLHLKERPKIVLINNNDYSQKHKSFGGYIPGEKKIFVVLKGRNLSDICRSLSHEMKHFEQDLKGVLTPESGQDGSEHENEANSFSGKIMREFNKKYPEILSISL